MIGKVHLTKDYARYRQFNPSQCIADTFRMKVVGKRTKLILCKKRSSKKYGVQSILKSR